MIHNYNIKQCIIPNVLKIVKNDFSLNKMDQAFLYLLFFQLHVLALGADLISLG